MNGQDRALLLACVFIACMLALMLLSDYANG